jgi:hypothetical protein
VDGFGLADNDDTRDLLAAAAGNPHTRWCVTTLNPDGTAAAHGCITGRHPPPGFAAGRSPGRGPSPGPDPPSTPPGLAPRTPGPADPHHPGPLRPPARRNRIPAQPQTPAPHQGTQRPLRRPRLRTARRPMRPGPHHRLAQRRPHLRMRAGCNVPDITTHLVAPARELLARCTDAGRHRCSRGRRGGGRRDQPDGTSRR